MILQRVKHDASCAGGVAVDDVMHRYIRRKAGDRAETVREPNRVLAGLGFRGCLERQCAAGRAVDRLAV